ncbi:hypothetical protein [Streptomyces kaempferi]|uniref:Uncharacterized protein n=1 Tax=Streptomyces kaempferi TaxID=333725 RepID=A0ABW3XHD9_9ACTN
MSSPRETLQQTIDDVRTAVQARQIIDAAATGGPAAAHQVANGMTTADLQRVQQHLQQ